MKDIAIWLIKLIGATLFIGGLLGMMTSLTIFGLLVLASAFFMQYTGKVKRGKQKSVAVKDVNLPLEEYLKSKVVGQDKAIKEIVSVIKMKAKRQEVEGALSPILGVFLFVGPTGVGKTETAKAIAEWFNWKYGHQFLQFDMGGFTYYHTASSLVGSPKGYIGSDEGGVLTRPLMHNPKAVILFDEMEKAYHTLYKPLMRLVDEGLIQEISTGLYTKLYQGVIIFTSNLFQSTIRAISQFVSDDIQKELLVRDVLTGKFDKVSHIVPQEVIKQDIHIAQGKGFPPEFIGRIDKIVIFEPLKEMDLVEIVARIMAKYRIPQDMKYAYQLTQKFKPIAKEYGVRTFLKKIEEELIRKEK